VIAQYLSGELQHHVSQTYQFDHCNPGSIDVLIPQENEQGEKQWFNGTADAVRKNLPTLLKSTANYFLILAGDQLYNINFQSMLSFAKEKEADLTIASLPVCKKDAKRMGLLKINTDGKILDFVEKPQEEDLLKKYELLPSFFLDRNICPIKRPCYLGSMGIYIFRRETLISLLHSDPRNDFGFHLITTAINSKKTYAFLYQGYWEDIGTITSYYDANLTLTENKKGLDTYDETNPIYTRLTHLPGPKIECTKIVQSIICEGSIIEAAEISHSVIGLRSHIRKGSIIRDTVMMGNHFYTPPLGHSQSPDINFGIGQNCLIEKTIIDEHVQIGNHVHLINEKKLDYYDGPGIFIRDGIIIVTAGTSLPDGFVL
jgi:glucose-1-phosphate adenylyltransferase